MRHAWRSARTTHASLERDDDLCYPTGMRFVPFNPLGQRAVVAVTIGATSVCLRRNWLAGVTGKGTIT
jgi:hypothetical protein